MLILPERYCGILKTDVAKRWGIVLWAGKPFSAVSALPLKGNL
jgi:hypothetical protein